MKVNGVLKQISEKTRRKGAIIKMDTDKIKLRYLLSEILKYVRQYSSAEALNIKMKNNILSQTQLTYFSTQQSPS
jgi:hypothetical protein